MEVAIMREYKSKEMPLLLIYTAPTKALCEDRFKEWSAKFNPQGIRTTLLSSNNKYFLEHDIAGILITTFERLESLLRHSKTVENICSRLCLLLIDDLHALAEDCGSYLEAYIARISLKTTDFRIIAASVGISNSNTVRQWFSAVNGRRTFTFTSPEGGRPKNLTSRHVMAFPTEGKNWFNFENGLNNQIPMIMKKYSSDLPTIVFCSTRKSAESCAVYLAKKEDKLINSNCDSFTDVRLNELSAKGIAFHHAGLKFEDRRVIENMFVERKLRVLCCTSTLAKNIHLPVHLVIIKGTKQYGPNGYEDYSFADIMRMEERGGTLKDANRGVTVIMTSDECRSMFEGGSQAITLKSSFEDMLAEMLLVQVALECCQSFQMSVEFVKRTFFGASFSGSISEVVMRVNELLKRENLINEVLNGSLSCPNWIRRATEEMLSIHSIRCILSQTPQIANHENLLKVISQAIKPQNTKIRQGDKKLYSSLKGCLKYGKVLFLSQSWQKAFVSIQVLLKRDNLLKKLPYSFHKDAGVILEEAKRISKALVYLLQERESTASLRAAIELSGAINGEMWHDSSCILEQIEGIGDAYSRQLREADIGTMQKLQDADPSFIELQLKRQTPFGCQLLSKARRFPRYHLETCLIDASLKLNYRIDGTCSSTESVLLVIAKYTTAGHATLLQKHFVGSTEETEIILQLPNVYGDSNISCNLMSLNHAGLNLEKRLSFTAEKAIIEPFAEIITPPKRMTMVDSTGLENLVPASSKNTDSVKITLYSPQRLECNHSCKDKLKCRHVCCKEGAKRKYKNTKKEEDTHLITVPELKVHPIEDRSVEGRIMQRVKISDSLKGFIPRKSLPKRDSSIDSENEVEEIGGMTKREAFQCFIRQFNHKN